MINLTIANALLHGRTVTVVGNTDDGIAPVLANMMKYHKDAGGRGLLEKAQDLISSTGIARIGKKKTLRMNPRWFSPEAKDALGESVIRMLEAHEGRRLKIYDSADPGIFIALTEVAWRKLLKKGIPPRDVHVSLFEEGDGETIPETVERLRMLLTA